jgi:hypothetical protein
LVRKDAAVVDRFIVPGSGLTTGGTSKSACAVCVQLPNLRLWGVSIHTTWGGNAEASQKRLHHLQQLHDALTSHVQPGDAVVIGGDFNCSLQDPQLAEIAACNCLKQFQRVQLPGNTFTHADGMFSLARAAHTALKRSPCIVHSPFITRPQVLSTASTTSS